MPVLSLLDEAIHQNDQSKIHFQMSKSRQTLLLSYTKCSMPEVLCINSTANEYVNGNKWFL